jgi:biopolymer transport protein ExbD
MKFRKKTLEKIPIDMTPMIDVVFQLMAFFIMTFSVVMPEGDFNIKLPLHAGGSGDQPLESVPVTVRLESDQDGNLTRLALGDREVASFAELRAEIKALVPGGEMAPGQASISVEIDTDYGLDYRYAIDALTAVTGYRNADGQIIKLLDEVRFAPPRKTAL